ncbi:glycosyltransferase [Streptomyces sp. W1SF4]|uniref:glycosyltransferase n=1 Tax=Streptomyces sp. W1SF4 TaxID=2305220 RepID=UPI0013DF9B6C|nr:glycosyltransferase [Streptomyces sp. W1SF4]
MLQIPETCGWNDYVALQESHLAARGAVVLRPGLCRDEPGFAPGDLFQLVGAVPDIVHLHWPEMLARLLADTEAVALLRELAARGTRLVQTVHELAPHEEGMHGNVAFIDEVDSLTHGAHFSTKEHELAARRIRSRLPGPALHLPHPLYLHLVPGRGGSPYGATIGCFGRLRPYKRTAAFAQAFVRHVTGEQRLLIAGYPEDPATHHTLSELAAAHDRVRYLPGFHPGSEFVRLLEQVDWVALPYQRVWSSGVLVAAAQQGRRILAPPPVGADAYGPVIEDWQIVEPWDIDNLGRRGTPRRPRPGRSAPALRDPCRGGPRRRGAGDTGLRLRQRRDLPLRRGSRPATALPGHRTTP